MHRRRCRTKLPSSLDSSSGSRYAMVPRESGKCRQRCIERNAGEARGDGGRGGREEDASEEPHRNTRKTRPGVGLAKDEGKSRLYL